MRFSPLSTPNGGYAAALSIPTFRSLHPQVVIEVRRARRYEHPLSVVVVSLRAAAPRKTDRRRSILPGRRDDEVPAVYGLLGAFLRNSIRETDILAGLPESLAFATFLPGVDRRGAALALQRMHDGFHDCAGVSLHGGVAAFPQDGLAVEDLLESACAAWRHPVEAPQAPVVPEVSRSHG